MTTPAPTPDRMAACTPAHTPAHTPGQPAHPPPERPARPPVRHLPPPAGVLQRARRARYGLARRLVQISVLLLFYGTLHAGWTLLGAPLLAGNLSAAQLAGVLPLADPFAVLQLLAARHALATEVLVGAAVTVAAYALLGGRVFCGWVCPMNTVTDTAAWLRQRLGLDPQRDLVRLPGRTREVLLVLALGVSALAGLPAFEAYSPISMLHRELIYGLGLGLTAALGILLLDTFVLHRGWCGHLCPLGAFWSLVGRVPRLGLVQVAFDDASCSRCGDCVRVCPEPRVLHFADCSRAGRVVDSDCTRCGRCVTVCAESSLRFDWRARIQPAPAATTDPSSPLAGERP
jgi:ferredoxin-type protein NapH